MLKKPRHLIHRKRSRFTSKEIRKEYNKEIKEKAIEMQSETYHIKTSEKESDI
jgi:hypothetical protein